MPFLFVSASISTKRQLYSKKRTLFKKDRMDTRWAGLYGPVILSNVESSLSVARLGMSRGQSA